MKKLLLGTAVLLTLAVGLFAVEYNINFPLRTSCGVVVDMAYCELDTWDDVESDLMDYELFYCGNDMRKPQVK